MSEGIKDFTKGAFVGIELGSTRIKAVLTDSSLAPAASGEYTWENRYENGYWTYSLDDIHTGFRECFRQLAENAKAAYGITPDKFTAMGISAMMHGYMAFDREGNLLTPFRTWRNTTAAEAATEMSRALGFNIPARWSAAHLYQAILDGEEHLQRLSHITTLAGYINYRLTGDRAVGIGEASGIFPVKDGDYDKERLSKFQQMIRDKGYDLDLREILPPIKTAGTEGAFLTEEGVKFIDLDGLTGIKSGLPLCPPEGDAGTGMTATNSVLPGTGNISAVTSVFSMLFSKEPLKGVYPEIDIVATPDGAPAAMVHCNNCCSELDAWVNMFGEFAELMGITLDKSKLYNTLYDNAMAADNTCGGVCACNFLSAEPAAGAQKGSPLYFRTPGSKLELGNFFRAQLYSAVAALKIGMDILFDNEDVTAEEFTGHGGFFKSAAGQQVMADALGTKVSTMTTAGEGGAWGMALLAAFMIRGGGKTLGEWLGKDVFAESEKVTVTPDSSSAEGFAEFMKLYRKGLAVQKAAGEAADS
ncbi:MAG: ATPase [Oscillospiraceae bacterium]|nr:ATPase [Oscillospiraceae bacterium]